MHQYALFTRLACVLAVPVLTSASPAPDFAGTVYPVLVKAGCPGCHSSDGVASGTRLHFPEEGVSAAAVTSFGLSLLPLVNKSDPDKSVLLAKPTRAVPHAGGLRIIPGSPGAQILKGWISFLTTHTGSPAPLDLDVPAKVVQTPALRRLTHTQYDNTLRDLLGDESNLARQFPPEDFVKGFKNQNSAQTVSPLLAEAYGAAAEKLAKNAFRGGDRRGLIPCKWTSAGDAKCADQFVQQFGRKAFRRPLTSGEVSRYRKLFAAGAADGKSFLAGAQLVVEAMLQSPNFLQRAENGAGLDLRSWETASRLSYSLWNSMPDEQLFRAAESGKLKSPSGLETEVRRMLRDNRSRAMVDDFLEQWLRFDRLLTAVKDRRSFPTYTPELALSMTEETRRMVADLVWNNRDFTEFFSADYSYLNAGLASLYGIAPPSRDFDKVPLPPTSERAGIIGQAVFLALTSKPADTSPTARGLFVREQFLCQDVPQPPPGVSTNLPPLSKDKPQTNRERLSMHLSSESCSSCHSLIDPIGFGMEKFDAIGQRREKLTLRFAEAPRGEKVTPTQVELELDTNGEIAGLQSSRFTSPREIGKILAASVQCQECVAKQFFRYVTGRREGPSDRPALQRIYGEFRDSQFRFQELIVSVMKWTEFPPGSKSYDSGTD
ncbi:MAG TPA: DUF1592 domain-containing protein [Bryobacteraceae bacterium]|nr:DUF1592 domain-containing protein [Bryobacteraceae bacterium]